MTAKMNRSRIYERQYREWIQKGRFEEQYQRVLPDMREALQKDQPSLLAMNLRFMATCYHARGVVALLDDNSAGWRDVQCGFWAGVYGLRFEIEALVLGGIKGKGLSPEDTTEAVMILGLAKLFGQKAEEKWLKSAIAAHMDVNEALGPKVAAGGKILDAIVEGTAYSFDELLEDRKECGRKREVWPPRPTEIMPFGVLDVEAMVMYPEEASFEYPETMAFEPTSDALVEEAVAAYHVGHEGRAERSPK
jgi:hypothetical protein